MNSDNLFIKNTNKNIRTILLSQVFTNLISLIILLLGLFYLNSDKYVEIQLIMTYLVFSGFIHLGIIDGIELRIAGGSIDKNYNGSISVFVFLLSSFPLFIYFVLFYNKLNPNIIIAFSTIPIINLNAFLTVLLRSYGFSWIAAYGLIYEKIIVVLYIFFTAIYSVDLIKFFVSFSFISFIYYAYKLNQIGVKFDFGLNFNKILKDLKSGSILMLSNILYSLISSGSIIIASEFYKSNEVSRLAISISFINLFIGVSFQVSSVIFPLMANRYNEEGLINHDKYNKIIQKFVPLIVFLFILCLYFCNIYLKNLYTTENILKYVFIMVPVVYFEIKNQIINIIMIKLRKKLTSYLFINLLSAFIGVVLLIFSSFMYSMDFLIFLYLLIFTFIFRFLILSFYCKTFKFFDLIIIIMYFIYLIILTK